MGFSMTMDATESFDTYHEETKNEKVLKILSEYIAGDELDAAMQLWQRQYSHQSIDKLSFFIFELESNSEIRSTRREILKKLQLALEIENPKNKSAEASLKAKEKPAAVSVKAKVEKTVIQREQVDDKVDAIPVVSLEGLNTYFEILLEPLSPIAHKELMEICIDYLMDSNLTTFVKEEIVKIIIGEGQPNHILYDVENIRGTINIVYSLLCECYGPIKADQTLAKAMAVVSHQYPTESFAQFL